MKNKKDIEAFIENSIKNLENEPEYQYYLKLMEELSKNGKD